MRVIPLLYDNCGSPVFEFVMMWPEDERRIRTAMVAAEADVSQRLAMSEQSNKLSYFSAGVERWLVADSNELRRPGNCAAMILIQMIAFAQHCPELKCGVLKSIYLLWRSAMERNSQLPKDITTITKH
jgi:hypothetical protein